MIIGAFLVSIVVAQNFKTKLIDLLKNYMYCDENHCLVGKYYRHFKTEIKSAYGFEVKMGM